MNSLLLAQLTLVVGVLLLIGMAVLHLRYLKLRQAMLTISNDRLRDASEALARNSAVIAAVHDVLSRQLGGLPLRLSESRQTAEVLRMAAPAVFAQHDSLAYWVHANDQFLVRLYEAAGPILDRETHLRIQRVLQDESRYVFEKIYAEAELSPPPVGAR